VIGAAPAILGKALISASRSEDFVNLTGIDATLEWRHRSAQGDAVWTAEGLEAIPRTARSGGILLGKDLARGLGVAVGDSVQS